MPIAESRPPSLFVSNRTTPETRAIRLSPGAPPPAYRHSSAPPPPSPILLEKCARPCSRGGRTFHSSKSPVAEPPTASTKNQGKPAPPANIRPDRLREFARQRIHLLSELALRLQQSLDPLLHQVAQFRALPVVLHPSRSPQRGQRLGRPAPRVPRNRPHKLRIVQRHRWKRIRRPERLRIVGLLLPHIARRSPGSGTCSPSTVMIVELRTLTNLLSRVEIVERRRPPDRRASR